MQEEWRMRPYSVDSFEMVGPSTVCLVTRLLSTLTQRVGNYYILDS